MKIIATIIALALTLEASANVHTAAVAGFEASQSPSSVCYIFDKHVVGKGLATNEIYEVFKAVLVSSGLEASFRHDLECFKKGTNKNDGGVKLIKALHDVTTAEQFKRITDAIIMGGCGNEDGSLDSGGPNTKATAGYCVTPRRDPRPNPVPVTPQPISPQN